MAAAAETRAVAEFLARLDRDPVKPADIAALLDGFTPEERVAAIRAAGRPQQRRLYRAVAGHGSVRLVDLVPPARRPFETVRHFGRNTLPAFTRFEKRFCRPAGQDAAAPSELWGYNFQTVSPLTGPGYYVAYEDPEHGEVLIDYTKLPPQAPPGWPAVRSNERGLSRLIYAFMVDRLRRVSEHVTIGSAIKNGREIGSWFLLCREPG
jgi:hypothetical protein